MTLKSTLAVAILAVIVPGGLFLLAAQLVSRCRVANCKRGGPARCLSALTRQHA